MQCYTHTLCSIQSWKRDDLQWIFPSLRLHPRGFGSGYPLMARSMFPDHPLMVAAARNLGNFIHLSAF
jgi:hypothetical protein